MFNSEENKMESIIEFVNPVINNISNQDQMRYLSNVDPEIKKKIEIGEQYLFDIRHSKFAKVREMFPFDPDNFSEEQFKNIEKGQLYIANHSYEFFGRFADTQDLVYNFVNHQFLLWYFFLFLLVLNGIRVVFILLFDEENRNKEYRGGFGGAIERGLRGIAVGCLWYPVIYPDTINRFYKTIYHAFPNLYVKQFILFRHFPGKIDLVYFDRDKYLGLVPTTSYLLYEEPTQHIVKIIYKTPKELVERWGGTQILQDYSLLGRIWNSIRNTCIWLFIPVGEKKMEPQNWLATPTARIQEAMIPIPSKNPDDFVNWLGKDKNFFPITADPFYLFTEKIKNFYTETHFSYAELPNSLMRFNFPLDFKSKILDFDFTKWKLINENDELVKFMNPFFAALGLPDINSGQVSIPLQGNANYQEDVRWIQNNVNNIFQNEANFEFNRLVKLERLYKNYLYDEFEGPVKSSHSSIYTFYHKVFDPLLKLIQYICVEGKPYVLDINVKLDALIVSLPMFIKANLGSVFAIVVFSYVLRRGRYYLGRLFRYYLGHTIILEMLARFVIPFYYSYYKWVEESSFILLSDQANEFTKFLYYYKDTHRDDFTFTADALGWVLLALPIILFIASQAEQYFYVKYLTDSALIHIGTRRPGEGD